MRHARTRLSRMMPVVSTLLAGCFNNVVTLATEDAAVSRVPDASAAVADSSPNTPPNTPPNAQPDATPGVPVGNGTGAVDLLVVMDTSNSMRTGQEYFNNQATSLVNTLIERHGVRDVRVGIVTTDLGVGDNVIPSCGVRGGDDGVMNPRLRGAATSARMPPVPPSPLFCNTIERLPFMTLRASDNAMFRYWAPSCHGTVGVGGCGLEQPLEAALRALTTQAQPGAPNEGFLRPEATLAVLVVSDEDDGSVRDCRNHDGVGPCTDATSVWEASSTRWATADLNLRFYQYTPGANDDPTWSLDRYVDPQRLNRGLLGLKPGHPERVVFAAVTGVPLSMPTRADGGTDWSALLGQNPDGSDGYVAMSPEGPVSMRARNLDPNCPGRVVPACRAQGAPFDPAACGGSSQDFAWPARRIAQLARRLDEAPLCNGAPCRNGMVTSICNTTDGSPLARFADMIARRVTR